ncbi:HD domain-containing phosphohydrolase [Terasakiella pusilla]|uniref:HD domain-containing phosphohydrolase n=1 Tax=Terasakiella pusilla TaxID=64973 RepID=UPI003AA95A97
MGMRVRFKVSIITLLVVMVVLVCGSISMLFLMASSQFSSDIATQSFKSKTDHAVTKVQGLLKMAFSTASVAAQQNDVDQMPQRFIEASQLPLLLELLSQNPSLYSTYYGFANDDFYQVIAVRGDEEILKRHAAPAGTAWIVRAIVNDGERVQRWGFLNKQRQIISTTSDPMPDYNPTQRPWYSAALEAGDVVLSQPYWFNSLKQPGITASGKLYGTDGVFGVDLTLSGLASELAAIEVSENGVLVLTDAQHNVLASSPAIASDMLMKSLGDMKNAQLQVMGAVWGRLDNQVLQEVAHEGTAYFAEKDMIPFPGTELYLGILAPVQDFSDLFADFHRLILIVSLGSLILFIPISILFSASLSRKVTRLTKAAQKVEHLEFDAARIGATHIVEFDELIQSFSHMSESLSQKTEELQFEQDKLSKLVDLGISLSSEKNTDRLMEGLMRGAKELTNADGCSLYTVNDNRNLEFKIVMNDSLGIASGGTSGNETSLAELVLYHEDGSPNLKHVACYAAIQEETVNIADVYSSDEFDFSGPKAFDESTGYRTGSMLTVPLKPRGGRVIGVLQIINAQDKYGDGFVAFDKDLEPFVEALAAQASTALYNLQLLEGQENLMDALIQLIAGAIDAKSPYTGGHCERVPELAIMLAKEACEADTGSFADFAFETDEEWREYEIGAWLHDCGKVVTPEYVVDKATKLETIYNRIHEVRTRFEVLLRDAQIDMLEAVANGMAQDQAQAAFEEKRQQLFDDFAFVAECNVGGEFMSDEALARLQKIATIQWKRHFDIKLGLSQAEEKRFVSEPDGDCLEYLLADKPFHVFPRADTVHEVYAERGFKLDVPDNLYDQGELYNLSIKRGTLTEEERFKINEHIIQSILMLEQLPLPDHLKRVPEYAGTHHETMIGTGYPRKLDAEDLSIPSRIMAIADIFEALTASDRPYKPVKTLSEAVKILSFFKKDQHIDGELFDLFLTSGVYKVYAERFLLPEQLDEVDITPYLG